MKRVPFFAFTVAILAIAAASFTTPVYGGAVEAATGSFLLPDNDTGISSLDYTFTPYGWLAGLEGTAGVAGRTADLDVSFGDVWDNLDFVWANTFEARKDRLAFFMDFMYLKLEPETATPGPLFRSATLGVEQLMLGLMGSYRLIEDDKATVDVLSGARYMWVKESLTLTPLVSPVGLTATTTNGWWDGIVAVKARYALTEKIFLQFYGDIGTGNSDLTWQLFGAAGYELCESASLLVGYRYLSYDYQKGGFVYDLDTKGPVIGLSVQF